jgi:transposase
MLQPAPAFAMADRVAQLTLDGFTASEIAQRLGLSHKQVLRVAARRQAELQPRGGKARLVAAKLSSSHYAVVRSLAEKAQITPSAMLARIAGCVLEDGPQMALRRLGKQAYPKRDYRRSA